MGKISAGNARFLQAQLAKAFEGETEAFYELGVAYSVGKDGIDIDLVEAHKWFNLAALKGDERAKEDRREVAYDMTSEEIAEAQRNARAFLDGVAA